MSDVDVIKNATPPTDEIYRSLTYERPSPLGPRPTARVRSAPPDSQSSISTTQNRVQTAQPSSQGGGVEGK